METNWILLGIVVIAALILVGYLIMRNLEDKEDLTKMMNEEDRIKEEAESDDDKDTVF